MARDMRYRSKEGAEKRRIRLLLALEATIAEMRNEPASTASPAERTEHEQCFCILQDLYDRIKKSSVNQNIATVEFLNPNNPDACAQKDALSRERNAALLSCYLRLPRVLAKDIFADKEVKIPTLLDRLYNNYNPAVETLPKSQQWFPAALPDKEEEDA